MRVRTHQGIHSKNFPDCWCSVRSDTILLDYIRSHLNIKHCQLVWSSYIVKPIPCCIHYSIRILKASAKWPYYFSSSLFLCFFQTSNVRHFYHSSSCSIWFRVTKFGSVVDLDDLWGDPENQGHRSKVKVTRSKNVFPLWANLDQCLSMQIEPSV